MIFGEARSDDEIPEHVSIYRPSFTALPANTLLNGMFQSFHYFLHLRERIRDELGVLSSEMLSQCDPRVLESVLSTDSVSVHIRRTDYLNQGVANSLNVCSKQYFLSCIDYFRDRINRPLFFIFSDDIQWARANITGADIIYVSSEKHRDRTIEDFVLMARCAHHVISNSTYSWWAAFAGLEGKVLMPDRWTNDQISPLKDKQIPGWETMPADTSVKF
jgi:hypothetical protein